MASKKVKAKVKAGNTQEDAANRRKVFVEAYLTNGGNASQAAVAAGFSEKTAGAAGSRLLKHVEVKRIINSRRGEVLETLRISTSTALEQIWGMATADVRELVEYRVGCCRYCYGKGNRYQRTSGEMARDEAAHAKANEEAIEKGKPCTEFDRQGGIGYDKRREPNAACQECFGEGVGRTVFKDTSKLSPAAATLYAGVKETKDGLEVKTHSKLDALEKIAKHLGLYEKDNKQRSPLEGISRESLQAVVERLSAKGR